MVPVAAICSTSFLLVSSRLGGCEMFWPDSGFFTFFRLYFGTSCCLV